jgi:plastocyanin
MAKVVLSVLLCVVVLAMASAADADNQPAGREYQVKWDFPTGDKYYSAVQGKTYYVGDSLKFTYMQEMHNVVKVGSFEDFNKCTMTKPLSPEFADGATSMPLDKPGVHYFICSIPGHCSDGMKIKVLAINRPRKLM